MSKNFFKIISVFLIAMIFTLAFDMKSFIPVANASSITFKHAFKAINIHAKASGSSKVIGTLPKNAPVFVSGTTGSYYKIVYKNKTAYTYKKM